MDFIPLHPINVYLSIKAWLLMLAFRPMKPPSSRVSIHRNQKNMQAKGESSELGKCSGKLRMMLRSVVRVQSGQSVSECIWDHLGVTNAQVHNIGRWVWDRQTGLGAFEYAGTMRNE